ncbi:uncharacterized protein LOC135499277 [Lineus longissimus]|uniref:uncharacterized protein LOC135499277 n=1 Tax=Lineus longissimus TaxID=88925 RepID=UPI002B4F9B2D
MRRNCPLTCGFCALPATTARRTTKTTTKPPPTTTTTTTTDQAVVALIEECEDKKSSCESWANAGFCNPGNQYERFMTKNCPVSCGLCAVSVEDQESAEISDAVSAEIVEGGAEEGQGQSGVRVVITRNGKTETKFITTDDVTRFADRLANAQGQGEVDRLLGQVLGGASGSATGDTRRHTQGTRVTITRRKSVRGSDGAVTETESTWTGWAGASQENGRGSRRRSRERSSRERDD